MVMATVVTAMVAMVVMEASGELEVLVDMDTDGNQKLISIYLFNKISDD